MARVTVEDRNRHASQSIALFGVQLYKMATQPTHITKSRTTLPIPMISCVRASGLNNSALICLVEDTANHNQRCGRLLVLRMEELDAHAP